MIRRKISQFYASLVQCEPGKFRKFSMTKIAYQEIRKNLDFSISSKWVLTHLSGDFLILVAPSAYFFWSVDQQSVTLKSVFFAFVSALCLAEVGGRPCR